MHAAERKTRDLGTLGSAGLRPSPLQLSQAQGTLTIINYDKYVDKQTHIELVSYASAIISQKQSRQLRHHVKLITKP